jgi:hypothetical protein
MTFSLQGDQFLSLDLINSFQHGYYLEEGRVTKKVLSHDTVIDRSFPSSKKAISDPMSGWWRTFLDNEDKYASPLQSIGNRSDKEISYIDLFSSVGGLSLGLEEAVKSLGFRPLPLLAVDVDDGALAIHKHNHGTKRVIHESVSSLIDFKVCVEYFLSKVISNPRLCYREKFTLRSRGIRRVLGTFFEINP